MNEPFFFSPSDLFGIYQSAKDQVSSRGAVICPPLFDEYRRSYRALSDLATALTQQNWHVLRFDYRGTGDSSSLLSEVSSISQWIDDIELAVDELTSISGAQEVVLVSIRAGALLASSISSKRNIPLVVWDPVTSGNELSSYLNEVAQWNRKQYIRNKRYVGHKRKDAQFSTFRVSETFLKSLQGLCWMGQEQKTQMVLSANYKNNVGSGWHTNLSVDYSWPVYEDGLIQPREAMESIVRALEEI